MYEELRKQLPARKPLDNYPKIQCNQTKKPLNISVKRLIMKVGQAGLEPATY